MQHMYQQARPHSGTAAGEQRANSSNPDTSCDRPCTSPPPPQQQQVVIAIGQPFQTSQDHLNPYTTKYKMSTSGLPGPYYQQQLMTTTHPHAEPCGLCVVPIEMPQASAREICCPVDHAHAMHPCTHHLGNVVQLSGRAAADIGISCNR
jgi:hypothetical protein